MAEGLVEGTPVFKVTYRFEQELQHGQFSFHLRDTGIANENAGSVVAHVDNIITAPLKAVCTGGVNFTSLEAVEITSKAFAQQTLAAGNGTLNAASFPSFVAVLVSLKTEQRARWKQGRFFLPALAPSFMAGSSIGAGGMAALNTFLDAMRAGYVGDPILNRFAMVVVSKAREANTHRGPIPHGWIDVVSMKGNSQITTLRRRKVGIGS